MEIWETDTIKQNSKNNEGESENDSCVKTPGLFNKNEATEGAAENLEPENENMKTLTKKKKKHDSI